MRRKTDGFAGFNGMETLVRFVEFGQSYQTLPSPEFSELV